MASASEALQHNYYIFNGCEVQINYVLCLCLPFHIVILLVHKTLFAMEYYQLAQTGTPHVGVWFYGTEEQQPLKWISSFLCCRILFISITLKHKMGLISLIGCIVAYRVWSRCRCFNIVALDVLQCEYYQFIYRCFSVHLQSIECYKVFLLLFFFFVNLVKVAMSPLNVMTLMPLHKLCVFIYFERLQTHKVVLWNIWASFIERLAVYSLQWHLSNCYCSVVHC